MPKNTPPPTCKTWGKPMRWLPVQTGGRRYRCIGCDGPDPGLLLLRPTPPSARLHHFKSIQRTDRMAVHTYSSQPSGQPAARRRSSEAYTIAATELEFSTAKLRSALFPSSEMILTTEVRASKKSHSVSTPPQPFSKSRTTNHHEAKGRLLLISFIGITHDVQFVGIGLGRGASDRNPRLNGQARWSTKYEP